MWSRQQESNLHLALRRHSFYPLNYGEGRGIVKAASVGLLGAWATRSISHNAA